MANPSSWKIESQQPTVGKDARGVYGPGVEIAFTTGEGWHGTIFIPKDQFSVANVKAAVAIAAANHDAIGKLTG